MSTTPVADQATPQQDTDKAPKAPDTRAINANPLGLPANIVITALFNGEFEGSVAMPQRGKLSVKGNVSYGGLLSASTGWILPGDDVAGALKSLSFSAQATDVAGNPVGSEFELRCSKEPVAANRKEDKVKVVTLTHVAIVNLPAAVGRNARYMVSARAETIIDGPHAGNTYLVCQAVTAVTGNTGVITGFGR